VNGVYNRKLFQPTKRAARNKLAQMGGIMASSPELMQAANPMAAMPVSPTGVPKKMNPLAPPPAPRPMGPGPMAPNVPAPTTVAPNMLGGPQQPKPQRPVQNPVQQQKPTGYLAGGPVDVGATPGTYSIKDMTALIPGFGLSLNRMLSIYGSEAEVEKKANEKIKEVQNAASQDSPEKVANLTLKAAGEKPTEANKKEFARTVFGMKDVNDIDEINRRIADVAIASSIGKGPDAFAQAVLFGLGEFKKTASARAEAAAEAAGGGFLDTEQGKAALEVYLEKIKNNEDPATVEENMNTSMGDNIGTRVRQAITGAQGNNTPSSGGFKVGQEAENPETGEVVVWNGSSWQPK